VKYKKKKKWSELGLKIFQICAWKKFLFPETKTFQIFIGRNVKILRKDDNYSGKLSHRKKE
jgi:hypothetical protein